MLPLEFTHTYICILRERERERVMSKTPKVGAIIDDYNLIFYWLITILRNDTSPQTRRNDSIHVDV